MIGGLIFRHGDAMEEMRDLLGRLRSSGIPVNKEVENALSEVFIGMFTDFPLGSFWEDRPTPFLITQNDAIKTISAPHMILLLLHHLELSRDQHVLLMGAKGGYMAALIDNIVGRNGMVTVIEPHNEVLDYTSDRLSYHDSSGIIRTIPITSMNDYLFDKKVDRILITGSIREIPLEIQGIVQDGGFILGPFGGPIQQKLLKKERQGDKWIDTNLGEVVFGPMDLSESERGELNPIAIAELIQDIIEIVEDMIEIDDETKDRIEDLIYSLKSMPSEIPNLDLTASDEEIIEHPVYDLLMAEMELISPIWPLLERLLSFEPELPIKWNIEDSSIIGGHEDLVP